MKDGLDGCYLKLDRAAEHIESFATESERFLAAKPFSITQRVNAEGTTRVYWFEPTTEPPARLSLLIGDCVNNMRSALDRFAYQLSVLADRQQRASVQFPIFTSERDFRDPQRGQRLMRDIRNPAARALLADLQPFQSPSSVRGAHPLAVLDRLCSIDHYRLMPLARPHPVAVRITPAGAVQPLPSKPFSKKRILAAVPANGPDEVSPAELPSPRLIIAFDADYIPYTGESAARVLRGCGTAVLGALSEAEERGLFPARSAAVYSTA